ncbi:hypothetical protein VHEMI09021 [[Torrubiella] hemipterigena]|uniref:Conserved oligomeric Golgi complex subunit 6 n=1 Tax=[Torrubiella] hemipterigena TaxID=1531966 RepID=A0A0A1T8J3_9HYPO|nr:hypothetical protein VHEMI09021 [[Torrubiella] hemipterigena]
MASTSQSPSLPGVRADNMSTSSQKDAGSSTLPIRSSNPLSAKVASLLSASYSDAGFKETLELIDERSIPIDAKGRRTFQLDLHKEIIDQNGQVLDEFRNVTEQMRHIQTALTALNTKYQQMKTHSTAAHKETRGTLEESSTLLQNHKDSKAKQATLDALRAHFILSDADIQTLTSIAEDIDEQFFAAFAKAKKISKDCERWLGFEAQTLGLELMAQLSKTINLAYQKLYRWTQKEMGTINVENPQMRTEMRLALRTLSERPSLFQSCLSSFADARQRILGDAFHEALTGSLPNGKESTGVKPIDMTAHDPLRYAGDMLAWIHSATVGEREILDAFFTVDGDAVDAEAKGASYMQVWNFTNDESPDGDIPSPAQLLNNLVDRAISSAARLLRQRVEQVIQGNEDVIVSYNICSLVGFYRDTFENLVGRAGALFECMDNLSTEATRQFRGLLRDRVTSLRSEVPQTPTDLRPPPFLLDSLKYLEAIAKTHESSLSTAPAASSEFDEILAEAFEPFLNGCKDMTKILEMPDRLIFLINCQRACLTCLGSFAVAKSMTESVSAEMNEKTAELATEQHQFLIGASGLGDVLNIIQNQATDSGRRLDLNVLEAASHALDQFLPSANIDAMERLSLLEDSTLARKITGTAVAQFCSDFDDLEARLLQLEESRGDLDLRTVFPRTGAEIRVLLS